MERTKISNLAWPKGNLETNRGRFCVRHRFWSSHLFCRFGTGEIIQNNRAAVGIINYGR